MCARGPGPPVSGKLVAMMRKPTCLMPALALALVANLLLAATFGAQPAHACSCPPPPGAVEQLQKADAVFSGEVVAVETVSVSPLETNVWGPSLPFPRQLEHALVTFDVDESWKGVSAEPVVVRNAYQPGSSCEGGFDKGERYLVHAHSNQDEDVPLSASTHVCGGGSGKLDYRGTALQTLGPAERAFPESVAPESADTTTPTTGFGSGPAPVVVASGALLFVVTLGALTLWRWRRMG